MKQHPELSARIRAALASPSGRLDHLVKATGLDPASDLKFGDWSGLDLSGADLRGFNFMGADLRATRFDNARIAGASFEGARYDPTALRKAADFDESGSTVAANGAKVNSGQAFEVLAGIGPDRISGDLSAIFSQMIWTLIAEKRKTSGIDKVLVTAANSPAFELLIVLWQQRVLEGKRGAIRPALLAYQIEEAITKRLDTKRSRKIFRDTLKLAGSNASPSEVQSVALRPLMRSRPAIRKSIVEGARALERLGLVEIRTGRPRGRRTASSEILLSRKGAMFVALLMEHAISSSADRLAAD